MFDLNLKSAAALVGVLTLLAMGLVIVLRSVDAPLNTTAGARQAAFNLTRATVLAGFWLFVMFLAQQFAGYNLALR